jgi:hypothetical protein
MVQRARDEYEFQLAALERGGYLNMDGNKASPEEMRRIKANFRRSKQKLADIVNEYKADGYSIPDEFLVMKADEPEDLEKRDATERALAADLSAYFAGLADRITIAISKADEVYLGKADKKEDKGKDEGGEDDGPFETDTQRRWFFAHLKDGENGPRSGNKTGQTKEGRIQRQKQVERLDKMNEDNENNLQEVSILEYAKIKGWSDEELVNYMVSELGFSKGEAWLNIELARGESDGDIKKYRG